MGGATKYDPNFLSTCSPLNREHSLTGTLRSGQVEEHERRMENSGIEASVTCTRRTIRSLRWYAALQTQDPQDQVPSGPNLHVHPNRSDSLFAPHMKRTLDCAIDGRKKPQTLEEFRKKRAQGPA
jgi:hypothetical protein